MSCDTEEDARQLVIATCPIGLDGHYYARELVEDQSLENLEAFAQKLERVYERMLTQRQEKK